jgi:hypothetical protein
MYVRYVRTAAVDEALSKKKWRFSFFPQEEGRWHGMEMQVETIKDDTQREGKDDGHLPSDLRKEHLGGKKKKKRKRGTRAING